MYKSSKETNTQAYIHLSFPFRLAYPMLPVPVPLSVSAAQKNSQVASTKKKYKKKYGVAYNLIGSKCVRGSLHSNKNKTTKKRNKTAAAIEKTLSWHSIIKNVRIRTLRQAQNHSYIRAYFCSAQSFPAARMTFTRNKYQTLAAPTEPFFHEIKKASLQIQQQNEEV